ncbi:MAG: tyrosine-protein phosphatase [Alphaproteobacteria bacterium]
MEYLHTAFEAIDAEFGSADAYLTDVLGVGAAEREALGKNYLD